MHARLLTADEVADRLNLHVRTVRRFIREGRLKATRIGKEYRIADTDLAGFAGGAATAASAPHAVASTIVDISGIGADAGARITTLVMAALNMRRGEPDFPRVDTIYYEEHAKLRITITANVQLTYELLRTIAALLEDDHAGHL